ncbi:apolipoprotein N-acyltransferase [Marinomonas mediterranea]|uniref:apolipoprotein N-acyltransferase n=1 Tax=Marinomonas mediterranea TaxID=119864 RepID=UPI00234A6380|nr:apolipoprotein N-acyltransferase [Marinomonas mediterranea]WCN10208.1 apolipoprotein N-acyltransferase [Marinomonas mediterranea]WCN14252.1 apolipoprotein N-acyltransferase [Marinomonas mediterranea]
MQASNTTQVNQDGLGWCRRLASKINTNEYLFIVLLVLSGAIGVLAFDPYQIWPAYFVSSAAFPIAILSAHKAKQALYRGLALGLGFFGAGVSWIYVSIANFGQVSLVIAIAITFGFVAVMALYWGLAGWLSWHIRTKYNVLPLSLITALSLLAFEGLRAVLFTGFPWLLPGYAIQNTWLFELLPIGGIWLTSFIVLLTAHWFACIVWEKRISNALLGLILLALWGTSAWLNATSPQYVEEKETLKVSLIQGNLSQDEKWLADQAGPTLAYYQQATINHLDADLVIWPETAITYLLSQVEPHLKSFSDELAQSKTTLITGVPVWDKEKQTFYNSVWATGNGFGLYNKQRLVPFGEYIPFSEWVGPILDIFGMPMSEFSLGEPNQPVLQAGELGVAPFVCYEIVYPELVRKMIRDSDLLITISNDGWFGDSIGPWQHLQIAEFRAKETGRPVLRATNTGITAIIDHNGNIKGMLPQFVRATLEGEIHTTSGITPYVRYGNLPLYGLILLLIVLGIGTVYLDRKPAKS